MNRWATKLNSTKKIKIVTGLVPVDLLNSLRVWEQRKEKFALLNTHVYELFVSFCPQVSLNSI